MATKYQQQKKVLIQKYRAKLDMLNFKFSELFLESKL